MRPSVARCWMAQITRYSRHPSSTRCRQAEGEAIFRALLSGDWVTLDLSGSGTTRKT
jgi:hypothetical protein